MTGILTGDRADDLIIAAGDAVKLRAVTGRLPLRAVEETLVARTGAENEGAHGG